MVCGGEQVSVVCVHHVSHGSTPLNQPTGLEPMVGCWDAAEAGCPLTGSLRREAVEMPRP